MKGKILLVGALFLVVAGAVCVAQSPSDPALLLPSGESVLWSEWISERGATAVVVWGAWMPDGDEVVSNLPQIESIASSRGLDCVVVAVQESQQASAAVMNVQDVEWLHDRHGALLKVFRVYDIPALVVVSADGTVLAKLDVSPQTFRLWEGP